MDVINDVPQTKIVEDSDIANLKGSATRPFYVWLKSVFLICFSIQQSGPSSQRPIKSLWIGRRYFDTDLNGPVYLASINPNVWVTAVGTPDKPPTLIAGDNIVIQNNAADNTQLISSVGGGAATKPAGSDTQIQFNNNGTFGANANLTWNTTLKTLNVGADGSSSRITGDFYTGNLAATVGSVQTRTAFQSSGNGITTDKTILTILPPATTGGAYSGGGSFLQFFPNVTSGTLYMTIGIAGNNTNANPAINLAVLGGAAAPDAKAMAFNWNNNPVATYNLNSWVMTKSISYAAVNNFTSVNGSNTVVLNIIGGDYYVRVNAASVNAIVSLPNANGVAANIAGRTYVIKKVDSTTNSVTITPTTGQTIDGAANLVLTQPNSSVAIMVTGTNWEIVSTSGGGFVFGTNSSQKIITVTANYTVLLTDSTIICNTNTAAFSVTLPSAASAYNASTQVGQIFFIKNYTTGTVKNLTIVGTIDGAVNPILSSNGSVMRVQSNGSTYYVV